VLKAQAPPVDAVDMNSSDGARSSPTEPAPDELLRELASAPVIRPAAVARGRARIVSGEHCPVDDVASQLVEDLMGRPPPAL
jgi:hypothetical protein